jgi:lipid-binding SYLF domain-containing protein
MLRTNVKRTIGIVIGAMALAVAGAAHADSDQELLTESAQIKASFRHTDPGLARFFEHAAGYAIFPGVGKAGIGIGGAHGSGILYDHAGHAIGRTTLNQVSVGAQLGGQEYAEIIFFETPAALQKFKTGNFAFSAAVSAVALKSGASMNARYNDGVAVFTATKAGLMLEASVGGQKFGFEPFSVKK